MSVGFAAILMGLAVDYGIVLYRHGLTKQLSAEGLRKAVGPSIFWAGSNDRSCLSRSKFQLASRLG